MSDITLIDSNFKVESKLELDDVRFYDVNVAPFKVYGVFYDEEFRRLPSNEAKTVNDGVYALHANTAGARVRFITDSPYVAIHAKMPAVGKMPHFALTGSAGFDLYVKEDTEKYTKTFVPPFNMSDGYESLLNFGTAKKREITINFPLYSRVSKLYVGLQEKAQVSEPNPYRIEKPIVYYGSSITQGGCASRPGNSYQSIVSRRLNADYVNLGFSGCARGEDEIAEYIKGLDMSAFVFDYDHNAPTIEHLKATHQKMFATIRSANPLIPIVLLSRPKYYLSDDEMIRLDIIKNTYNEAKANGDENVYLIDGPTLMAMAKDEGTVDGCHPNDLGFASMAVAVGDLLEKIL